MKKCKRDLFVDEVMMPVVEIQKITISILGPLNKLRMDSVLDKREYETLLIHLDNIIKIAKDTSDTLKGK
jgi:hypothetical protein